VNLVFDIAAPDSSLPITKFERGGLVDGRLLR
jgi:hypothetical protein